MKIFRGVVIFILFSISGLNLWAQENNYWNHQYGAKSSLLCGAAVAFYFDNGAIYYNPATLCFKDSGNVALSANLYNAEILNRKNALGEGLDLKSTNFNFSPQIVSGNKKVGKRAEVEFILLSRSDVQFNQNLSFNKIYNDTNLFFSNASLYVSSYNYRKRVLDEWAGLSMSFNLSKHVGIGIASFVSYRLSRYYMGVNASSVGIYSVSQPVSKSDSSLSLNSTNINLINKIGWVYHGDKSNFGMTLTLPSLHLWGKSQLEYSVYESDPNNNIPTRDVYLKRRNLRTRYKNPLSFSAGYSRKYLKSRFHISMEYFTSLEPYVAVALPETPPESNSGDVELNSSHIRSFEDARKGVLNMAIAWERYLRGETELLFGFATDFNSRNQYWNGISDVDFALNQEEFNLYHFSAGVGFQHKKNTIAVGLILNAGGGITQSIADFQNPTALSKFLGFNNNSMYTKYSSYGIVVGLTY